MPSTQPLKFSQEPPWLCQKPVLNGQVRLPIASQGTIAREEPAVRTCTETRRKDVGIQKYASGGSSYEPTFVEEPIVGTLPTTKAVFFLRDQYPDSSQPTKPDRYFK